jgi:hypothetical protein
MAKWADYLISAVRYNQEHTHIIQLKAHEDQGDKVGPGKIYERQTIVNAIRGGTTFVTIYKNKEGTWSKGEDVIIINVNGVDYLKTEDNGKEEDNLENLPEF